MWYASPFLWPGPHLLLSQSLPTGYDILPLSPLACPPTMTVEVAMKNLAKDAAFYGLDSLVDLLAPCPEPQTDTKTHLPTNTLPSLDCKSRSLVVVIFLPKGLNLKLGRCQG